MNLKYEKLPQMCLKCGWMVHNDNGCSVQEETKVEKDQFGPWLRVEKNPQGGVWKKKNLMKREGGCDG